MQFKSNEYYTDQGDKNLFVCYVTGKFHVLVPNAEMGKRRKNYVPVPQDPSQISTTTHPSKDMWPILDLKPFCSEMTKANDP